MVILFFLSFSAFSLEPKKYTRLLMSTKDVQPQEMSALQK